MSLEVPIEVPRRFERECSDRQGRIHRAAGGKDARRRDREIGDVVDPESTIDDASSRIGPHPRRTMCDRLGRCSRDQRSERSPCRVLRGSRAGFRSPVLESVSSARRSTTGRRVRVPVIVGRRRIERDAVFLAGELADESAHPDVGAVLRLQRVQQIVALGVARSMRSGRDSNENRGPAPRLLRRSPLSPLSVRVRAQLASGSSKVVSGFESYSSIRFLKTSRRSALVTTCSTVSAPLRCTRTASIAPNSTRSVAR